MPPFRRKRPRSNSKVYKRRNKSRSRSIRPFRRTSKSPYGRRKRYNRMALRGHLRRRGTIRRSNTFRKRVNRALTYPLKTVYFQQSGNVSCAVSKQGITDLYPVFNPGDIITLIARCTDTNTSRIMTIDNCFNSYSFLNKSYAHLYCTIYWCKSKVDTYSTAASATVDHYTPAAAYATALLAEQGTAGGTVPGYDDIRINPYRTKQFFQYWRIIRTTKFRLTPNTTKVVRMQHRNVKFPILASAGVPQLVSRAGLTVYPVIFVHGRYNVSSADGLGMVTEPGKIIIGHEKEYQFRDQSNTANVSYPKMYYSTNLVTAATNTLILNRTNTVVAAVA